MKRRHQINAALWLFAVPAVAGPTHGPEVNASQNAAGVYSETSAAISPTDPRNIIIGYNHIGGDGFMPVSVSRDRGATYTRTDLPHVIAGTTYHSVADPSVAFDSEGNAYYGYMVATGTLGELYHPVVAVLKAGQAQWNAPVLAAGTTGDDDKPYIGVDAVTTSPYAARVYMAWDRFASDGSQSILVARSTDRGSTWQLPVRVDDPATSSGAVIYAMPATGPNGELYVVWNDYGEVSGGSLRVDRSLDGGVTFGADAIVTDLRLNLEPDPAHGVWVYAIPAQNSRGIAACPSIGVDTTSGPSRGTLYVCYGDRAPGKGHDDVDVFARRSSDGGATWSAPVRVNDDATTTSQFFPWMSVDPVDGSLNVCWYDCRNDPANTKADVYYARSRDGGASFEANVRVTTGSSDQSHDAGDPMGNQFGDYLGMAAFGGEVAAAWTDARNGYNQAYTKSIIQPAAPPIALSQTALGLAVPAGVSLGRRDITLNVCLTGPASGLAAEWEVKPAGVVFDGADTTVTSPIAFKGAPVAALQTLTGLAKGSYHWRVRAGRADDLALPSDWAFFSTGPDFLVGLPEYTFADVARALSIAGGMRVGTASDAARLDVLPPSSGSTTTLRDAVCIARAVAGLAPLP